MSETPGHPISAACVTGSEDCGEPTCEPESYTQFEVDLAAIYDEIFAIRDGEPVILRTYDLYLAPGGVGSWRQCGSDLERMCTQCLSNFSDAIHRVAADYGVPVAGLLRGFSGLDLDQDMPAEYVSDGIHPSHEGAAAIAEIFANLGYEPVAPPS